MGLVVGWLMVEVRARITDTPVEITASLLTPYAAYLPAELLGVSGVLAAVTAGLYIGRRASRIMGSAVRVAGRGLGDGGVPAPRLRVPWGRRAGLHALAPGWPDDAAP